MRLMWYTLLFFTAVLQAKIERRDSAHPTLLFEYLLYKRFQEGPGVPRLVGYCEDGMKNDFYEKSSLGDYRVLVMERLGNDFWHLVVGKQRRLTLSQIAYIGFELLDSIEYVHACGFVHRDIKPGNIMLGHGTDAQKIYLIDFGLAKKVVSASTTRMLIEDKYVKVFYNSFICMGALYIFSKKSKKNHINC